MVPGGTRYILAYQVPGTWYILAFWFYQLVQFELAVERGRGVGPQQQVLFSAFSEKIIFDLLLVSGSLGHISDFPLAL